MKLRAQSNLRVAVDLMKALRLAGDHERHEKMGG